MLALTIVIDVIGTGLVYAFERHVKQSEIHSLFDAFFFTTVQLLTVSSQIKNPLTTAGRLVDIFLEVWAVVVVAGSAGAIASFFQTADTVRRLCSRCEDRRDRSSEGVHRRERRERLRLVGRVGIRPRGDEPPDAAIQFVATSADGFTFHQDATIQSPDWWKIEFHHLPQAHVTATWDGGEFGPPGIFGRTP